MKPSLAVLFPVYNAESTLPKEVAQTLETVLDLTDDFEFLIVDDGSTDATNEVLEELARFFPQITSIRHPEHRGLHEAMRTGLKHTSARLIYLRGEPKTADYQLLDRRTLERFHPCSHPARPKFLPPSEGTMREMGLTETPNLSGGSRNNR